MAHNFVLIILLVFPSHYDIKICKMIYCFCFFLYIKTSVIGNYIWDDNSLYVMQL